jgi:protein-L-isoaspartate(D-aspartate) O-methyltransferase
MKMDLAGAKARLINRLRLRIKDERVLEAMARIPRECFVPANCEYCAYIDEPLPIGYRQTISQPLIVALMTEALQLKGSEKVLEVGTGSGYQAAILAELAREVITVERVASLIGPARSMLKALGYTNIKVRPADSNLGSPADSPYDAIMVTACAPKIPIVLVEQLKSGGRLVIPVGKRHRQELLQLTRMEGRNLVKNLGGCRFVPLIGPDAWEE